MNEEVGYVISSRNFLVHLDGLPTVKIYDLVESEERVRGVVNALFQDSVEVLILDEGNIQPGQMFKKLDQDLSVEVGEYLIGRAINPLGAPIDGKRPFAKTSKTSRYKLDQIASGISTREFINEQFVTGVTLVDSLIPLGRGQRELILGDAHSGKTGFLIDTIVNQKNFGTLCIYASIGKPIIQVKALIDALTVTGALDHTIVIAASATEPTPLIYLTPQTAFTVAEHFQKIGKNVLLILDDVGIHAKVYRELSLLAGKSPGRESYPGDIFYQHAHLLERAGRFKTGGSITALPVIELNLNDFTTFIPTNVMGMTDGHLLFKSTLNKEGFNPAIDISLSVSRVGRQTQSQLQNLLSSRIRQVLAEAADLETVKRFSAELPFETRLLLLQKEIINEIIKQEALSFSQIEIQIILLGLVFTTFFQDKTVEFVKKNKKLLIDLFSQNPEFLPITKSVLKMQSLDEFIKILDSVSGKLSQYCQETATTEIKLPIQVQQSAVQAGQNLNLAANQKSSPTTGGGVKQ